MKGLHVAYLSFINGLDLQPRKDEIFIHEPGTEYVYVFLKNSTTPPNYPYNKVLVRLFNLRTIQELEYTTTPPEEVPVHAPTKQEVCICEDTPNPFCPVHCGCNT